MSVRTSTGTVIGFDSPPFQQTQRRHLGTRVGDSEWAIRSTAKIPAGPDHVKCLDFNVSAIKIRVGVETIWLIIGGHWSRFWLNGFTMYVPKGGHHMVPIPVKQRHWTVQKWVDHYGGNKAALKMLRRKNGEQIMTWNEAVNLADRLDVVLCPELKSLAFRFRSVCAELVAQCRRRNYPCWPMALLKMRYCKEKCSSMILEGGFFALILGKFRSMARTDNKVKNWKVKPSAYWFSKSLRQQLLS